jgi:2-polyprenyl-3-methyl-5-hydroxy-6-metoxy-1,4-benzoquinol methylase
MKIRDSGMPDEQQWNSFFDADRCLDALDFPVATEFEAGGGDANDINRSAVDVVDFGCGYGLFTAAAAARTKGIVYALDLEPEMIAAASRNVGASGLKASQWIG